jgi:putative MATE family efflux protein
MTLGAADTFMLSRYSDESVAAVGLVNQLVNIVFIIFQVISMATSILCSQYVGAGQRDRVLQVMGISVLFNFLIGMAFSAVLYGKAADLLGTMGVREELFSQSFSYMRIVGAFAFFQAMSLSAAAALRSVDMAHYPMFVSGLVNVINIVGNYALIFGKFGLPALGVQGAAISTVACRALSSVLLLCLLFRKYVVRLPKGLFRPFPWQEAGKLFKVGIPSAGEQMSYSLSMVVVTYFINFLGNDELATRTYAHTITTFVYLFSLAAAQGGAIVIGHLAGMKKYDAAFALGRRVLRVSVAVTFVLSFITACFGHTIFSMLSDNEHIIRMGSLVLWVDILVEVGRAINLFGVNSLRSAGDIYYPVTVGIIVCWTVAVGGSWLLGIGLHGGLIALWCALILDENIRGLIFIRRWKSRKWTSKSLV